MGDSEDYNYKERRYMEEQNEIEKNIMILHPPWLLNNITYCYEGENAPNNVGKKHRWTTKYR